MITDQQICTRAGSQKSEALSQFPIGVSPIINNFMILEGWEGGGGRTEPKLSARTKQFPVI